MVISTSATALMGDIQLKKTKRRQRYCRMLSAISFMRVTALSLTRRNVSYASVTTLHKQNVEPNIIVMDLKLEMVNNRLSFSEWKRKELNQTL